MKNHINIKILVYLISLPLAIGLTLFFEKEVSQPYSKMSFVFMPYRYEHDSVQNYRGTPLQYTRIYDQDGRFFKISRLDFLEFFYDNQNQKLKETNVLFYGYNFLIEGTSFKCFAGFSVGDQIFTTSKNKQLDYSFNDQKTLAEYQSDHGNLYVGYSLDYIENNFLCNSKNWIF